MEMKQIIVMRSDLKNVDGHKVRTGKLIAQGAHASMGAVLPVLERQNDAWWLGPPQGLILDHIRHVREWLAGSFTKITVKVDSEEELLEVVNNAEAAGLINCLITDNGRTEFGGVPTNTCAAIGPATAEELEPITGHLKLL